MLHTYGGVSMAEIRDLEKSTEGLLAMKSGATGRLLKVQHNSESYIDTIFFDSVFLDVFDFTANGVGVMMGDPVGGYFSLYCSYNYGKTWISMEGVIPAADEEFGFAASGTTLRMLSDTSFVFVTGGSMSNFYHVNFKKRKYLEVTYKKSVIPFPAGQGSGAFSMTQLNDSTFVVVGGDFIDAKKRKNTCFISQDSGLTWTAAKKMPGGYRSCVVYDETNGVLYCSGRNGVDYSLDGGRRWKSLTKTPAFSLTLYERQLFGTSMQGEVKIFTLKVN